MNHTNRDPRLITPEEYETMRYYATQEEAMKAAEYKAFKDWMEEQSEEDYLPSVDEDDFIDQHELDEMTRETLGEDYL